jgi:hypothetical protein
MDGLFAAIYDMQRAAIEGEVRYRFPAETSQDIKDFFNGMNAENAARVVKWAETNLSNKAVVDTVNTKYRGGHASANESVRGSHNKRYRPC